MPYEPKHYSKFRMIAYEVPTNRPIPAGEMYQALGRFPIPPRQPHSSIDARIRLRRLAGVINTAYNHLDRKLADDRNTLKIFVVPEFYFRPHMGGTRAYTSEEAADLVDGLLAMFRHRDLTDWLFVCGTYVLRNTINPPKELFLNSCVVVKGGESLESPTTLVQKQFFHLTTDGMPVDGFPRSHPRIKAIISHANIRSNALMAVDHRRIGVEICLDHNESVLRKISILDCMKHGAARQLDLHIVVACGLNLGGDHIAAMPGGYIFRCDGSPHVTRHTALFSVRNGAPPGSGIEPEFGPRIEPEEYLEIPGILQLAFVPDEEERNVEPDSDVEDDEEPQLAADNPMFIQKIVYYPALPFPVRA